MSRARYTVARGPLGLTPISRAQRGERYTCTACDGELVPKLGKVLRHHYAHAPGAGRCDADWALRVAAQHLILSGLAAASASGTAYYLDEPCLGCGAHERVDIAHAEIQIEPGGRIASGVSADVAVWHPEAGPLAILIATADAPVSDLTWRRNEASGTPSVLVEPTWGDVAALEDLVAPTRTASMDRTSCSACRPSLRASDVEVGLRRLAERRAAPPGEWPFTPWRSDRYGRPLFWSTRRAAYAGAIVLVELGFTQAAAKPWLFWMELAPGRVVFADYGSTQGAPIWEDTAALLYWRFQRCTAEEAAALVSVILRRCREAGAPVRLHTSYQGLEARGWEKTQPDPIATVDPALLQELLDSSEG